MKFRKKPVEIEAIQFDGSEDSAYTIAEKLNIDRKEFGYIPKSEQMGINTLEGNMVADKGDWIIKGIKGECYPCKPDIFDLTYDKVSGELVGCKDPERTQDDGDCYCNECSMGENPDECKSFRDENKLILM